MRVRTFTAILLGGLLAVGLALPAEAQTTGRIVGTVVDAQDRAVPGATVTATSPQLQGARTAQSDTIGQYRFPTLPPGTYSVKAELSGFRPVQQDNIAVGLDKTATVNLTLQVGGVEQSVTVTTAAPNVDVTSAAGGIHVTPEIFSQLAVRRDFYAISRLAPGVNDDAVGPAAHGSSGAENQYIVEGLNMTGITHGEQRKRINFDLIQEINVKSEGLNSEYGRMTGTVIEAITKSGGNIFHGALFGYGTGGALIADDSTAAKRPLIDTQVSNTSHEWDVGFDLGGYLVKDKLWFFGAYDGINERQNRTIIRALTAPGAPGVGSVIPADIIRQTFAGKVTYNVAQNQSIVGSLNGDPTTRDGAIFNIAGPESTYSGELETGGIDGVVRYNGVFRNTWLAEGFYGRHNENVTYKGLGRSVPLLIDQTVTPNARSGGWGFFQELDAKRDQVRATITNYFHGHTFKGGVDFERVDTLVEGHQGGAGQQVAKLVRSGTIFYRHRFFVNDLAPGFDRSNPSTWTIQDPLASSPLDNNTAVFVQDTYRALSNLTIDVGARWERQDIYGRDRSTKAISLKDNWAGRLGVVFDPTNDGRTKVFGYYGRFFESIPLDINIRAFGGEVTCFCYNFSPSGSDTLPDASAPLKARLLGGSTEPVDPDLKGQYIDEYLFGFEREVAPDLVVSARYNYRKLGRVIEDFLVVDEGNFFIANPAEGTLGKSLTFYDYSTVPSPKAKRTNKSFELSARKRFSNNWQLISSYVWAKLEGNYDGLFQNSTGQLDPNINSAFDYADFLVNADGPLTNDRRHQVKVDGSYAFSRGPADGLTLGVSTRYLSGQPLTAFGYSFLYANWEYYLTPRGALGRGPADWEADLNLGYPVRLGGNKSLRLSLAIFNLFNRQANTLLDQHYNLPADGNCAGIPEDICNGDNGLLHSPNSLIPLGQLSNVRANAPNPDFLKAGRGFTAPFSARIGARLSF